LGGSTIVLNKKKEKRNSVTGRITLAYLRGEKERDFEEE